MRKAFRHFLAGYSPRQYYHCCVQRWHYYIPGSTIVAVRKLSENGALVNSEGQNIMLALLSTTTKSEVSKVNLQIKQ